MVVATPNPGDVPTEMAGPQLMWLPPGDIIWPETRITSQYRDGEREALATSIRSVGQQQAIGVMLVDHQYVGVDGKNRCMEAVKKGEPQVLCLVRIGDMKGVILGNIATALLRGHTNPLDEVLQLWKAYDEEGVDMAELAMSAGKTVDWVEARLRIATASPKVQQYLGEELIALGHAEALSQLEDHAEQEQALDLVLLHRWTVDELKAHLIGKPPEQDGSKEPAPPKGQPRACTICRELQAVGGVQSMLVCAGCMATLSDTARAQATRDAALAGTVRGMMTGLREAETVLAGAPGTVALAEGIARLLELAEGETVGAA